MDGVGVGQWVVPLPALYLINHLLLSWEAGPFNYEWREQSEAFQVVLI